MICYMIWKALNEIFQNHTGFAIIRARGKELSHGKHGLFYEEEGVLFIYEGHASTCKRDALRPLRGHKSAVRNLAKTSSAAEWLIKVLYRREF